MKFVYSRMSNLDKTVSTFTYKHRDNLQILVPLIVHMVLTKQQNGAEATENV